MNKIIFLIMVMVLSIGNFGSESFAQKETKNFTDTLIVGGFYRVALTSGKQYTGEITDKNDSTIDFQTKLENFRLTKSQIRSIRVAKSDFDESNIETLSVGDEIKFRFLSSFQAGVNIPVGNFGENYKTGFGIQLTAYHLFDRVIGMGAEFQYSNFPGGSYSYSYDPYSSRTTKWDSYNLLMLKMNFIAGNLNPNNKMVVYGLFGFGIQYYSLGDVIVTETYMNYYSEYENSNNSDVAFAYGIGAGGFYKVSKNIGINCEFQFNKISVADDYNYNYNYDYNDGVNGYFSIKVGIMYTKF